MSSFTGLQIDGFAASYEGVERTPVFTDVSLSIAPGQIVGLFGPNGCGKSTLLRCIAGTKQTEGGQIFFSQHQSESGTQPLDIAVIPQNYRESFLSWTNLRHNILLTLPKPFRNRAAHLQHIEAIRDALGFDLDLGLRPHQCSGGMLQQAAIVRAFAGNARVLLADEPFSALDVELASKARKAMRRMVSEREMAGLIVLHDLQDVVEVCDKVLVIPDKPFTTGVASTDKGVHRARLMTNRRTHGRNAANSSLMELAAEVLRPVPTTVPSTSRSQSNNTVVEVKHD